MAEVFPLKAGHLSLQDCKQLRQGNVKLALDEKIEAVVQAAAHCVETIVSQGLTVYGVNTGFGLLADQSIATDKLEQLQRNLVVSHAVGVGEPLTDDIVRLVLALKINNLSLGHSGVRFSLLEKIVTLYNFQVLPKIPSQGSVGASGDLAPLAHCFLPLLGLGQVSLAGKVCDGITGLTACNLQAIQLAPKEGLALLNGTQVSTAIAVTALLDAEQLLQSAVTIGATSSLALAANRSAFDPRIHAVRQQTGQSAIAAELARLLSSADYQARKVQDPYSVRCQPQVLGACLDTLQHCAKVLTRECNAVSDNPLVFADKNEILSGGNFHAEPVAMVADFMALALAEIGSISERRIALMIDKNLSGLPAFLVRDSGLHSGFMIAHVTAAALVSENKQLATPASVDSLSTSGNQEDHVSMATHAALRLHRMIANVRHILAIEYLAASQACLLQPERSWPEPFATLLNESHQTFGEYSDQQVLAEQIEQVVQWLKMNRFAISCQVGVS